MNQGFRKIHPFVSFSYYVVALLFIMMYQHPFYLFFSCILLVFFNFLLDEGRSLKRWSGFLFVIPVLFLLITPIFNNRGSHLLFYFFQRPVTLEGILQGLMNGLSLFAVIALFLTFNMVITPDKFLFLFAKWFPQWAVMMMLSFRFLPLFRRRMDDIIVAQKTRGISLSEGPLKKRAQNGLLFLQILLTWALEDGIQTADSMAARGYGLQGRSKYSPYRLTGPDICRMTILSAIFAAGIFGWWLGDGVLTLMPVLEPVILYGREWLFFTVYMLGIGFPIIMEIKEALKWQFWKRNM